MLLVNAPVLFRFLLFFPWRLICAIVPINSKGPPVRRRSITSALRSAKCAPGPGVGGITLKGAPAGRPLDHGYMSRSTREARVNRKVGPCVRLNDLSLAVASRIEAAAYIGVSPSKFDELRKANRVAPPKILDGRLIFTVERLDEFLDALPDENHEAAEDWTVAV